MSWYLVVNALGTVMSEGTEVSDVLPEGWESVEVDGPQDGREWDHALRQWCPLVVADETPEPSALEEIRAALEDLRGSVNALIDAVGQGSVEP